MDRERGANEMASTRGNHRDHGQRQRAQRSLEQLERRFARFRRKNPGQTRIPDALRRDALTAVRLGVTRSQLRNACGISSDQLKHWQGDAGSAVTEQEPDIQEARVFSILEDVPAREPECRGHDEEQQLELRLGDWSISVRRGPVGVGG
jgi:hypothetical protein